MLELKTRIVLESKEALSLSPFADITYIFVMSWSAQSNFWGSGLTRFLDWLTVLLDEAPPSPEGPSVYSPSEPVWSTDQAPTEEPG